MLLNLSLLARWSVITLTALATLPAAATAAPLGPVGPTAFADDSGAALLHSARWGGGRWGGGWGHRGFWRHGGWGHYGGWGRRRGWGGWGSGFALGLGLGLPLGYYDSPYYARPYYRRYYGGSSSHVDWCYARYRSYRAWDDTWQPYYGPRRHCISPY